VREMIIKIQSHCIKEKMAKDKAQKEKIEAAMLRVKNSKKK